jgi:hypothetical protein
MSTTIGRHRISKQYSHVVLPAPYIKNITTCVRNGVSVVKDMGDLNLNSGQKTVNTNMLKTSSHRHIIPFPSKSGLIVDEALSMLVYKQWTDSPTIGSTTKGGFVYVFVLPLYNIVKRIHTIVKSNTSFTSIPSYSL